MPRVSDVYQLPSSTVPQVANTTVESSDWNTAFVDLKDDANASRPIIAGGTSATSANQARLNLGAEIRGQQVANYASHNFEWGSFASAPGANDAPDNPGGVSSAFFYGTALGINPGSVVLLRAWNASNYLDQYERRFDTAAWGAWKKVSSAATGVGDGDGIAANTGDMWYGVRGTSPTSKFVVNSESDLSGTNLFEVRKDNFVWINALVDHAQLNLNKKSPGAFGANVNGYSNGSGRWTIALGSGEAESGGNAGTDFKIYRYNDAGGFIGVPLTISRATGAASFENAVTVPGVLTVGGTINNSVTSGFNAVLNGPGASQINFQRAGVSTFYIGSGAASASNPDFNFYNVVTATFPLVLPSASGGVTVNGTLTANNALNVNSTLTMAGSNYISCRQINSPAVSLTLDTAANLLPVNIVGSQCNIQSTTGLAVTNGIRSTAAGNLLGAAGGSIAGPTRENTNILLHNNGSGNWAGIGADTGGSVYIAAGNVGVATRFWVSYSGQIWSVSPHYFQGNAFLSNHTTVAPGVGNTAVGVMCNSGTHQFYVSVAGGVGLFVNSNSAGALQSFANLSNGVGSISVTASATAYNTSSDARLKEDLQSFDAGHIIDETEVYDFKWKSTGERAYGVIAQQAVEVYPTPTFYDKESDRYFIDYSKYVPVLLQELKSVRGRVADLEVLAGTRPEGPKQRGKSQ